MSDLFAIQDPGDPQQWPLGSRVIVPEFEDMHFFRPGAMGTVVRHADHRYLGVIVRLDRPFTCSHGHYEHFVEEFNFSAATLSAAEERRKRREG